jgi:RNA polymerase sigma-70 factor (ECF subfamily)
MSAAPETSTAQEQALLAAARTGDEAAFSRLVEPHQAELHAHCYRMLGSVHDAEDALQETLLRAWRGLPRFEGRSSLRTWLYRIATNTCVDAIERRPKLESVAVDPYPDEQLGLEDGLASPAARYEQRESVELAFLAAVQHLPASQRAALLLRDVLGFSAKETAEALETTVASANGALRRARAAIDERLPEQSQQATLRQLGDERTREVVERYMDALDRGDLEAIVAMLADDATWTMPPMPGRYHGIDAIAGFLTDGPFRDRWRHRPARANGHLAVGCYKWDDQRGTYVADVLDVLTLRGDRIGAVTAFVDGELFPSFGLPSEIRA